MQIGTYPGHSRASSGRDTPPTADEYQPRMRETRAVRGHSAPEVTGTEATTTTQLRERLAAAESARAAAAAEVSRLAAANEELTIAKHAMLADMQVLPNAVKHWYW